MKSVKVPVRTAIVLAVFLSIGPLHGQSSNVSLSLGAGLPELLNAGVSYNTGKMMFGGTLGTFPVFEEKILSVGMFAGLHFAGRSKYTELPPWYAQAGFNYIRDELLNSVHRYNYLSVKAGREMNLSSRAALALDGGILIETNYSEKQLDPESEWSQGESWFPVLPAVSLKFIWRLSKDAGGTEK